MVKLVVSVLRHWSLFEFFFFQAEDGIRDVAVTGVQTCALPICDVGCLVLFVGFSVRGARVGDIDGDAVGGNDIGKDVGVEVVE